MALRDLLIHIEEMEDANIQQSLDLAARQAGCSCSNEVVEIVGRCVQCIGSGH
jgi:Fe2+ or Zn2+ uptake regulation protein